MLKLELFWNNSHSRYAILFLFQWSKYTITFNIDSFLNAEWKVLQGHPEMLQIAHQTLDVKYSQIMETDKKC